MMAKAQEAVAARAEGAPPATAVEAAAEAAANAELVEAAQKEVQEVRHPSASCSLSDAFCCVG